MPRSSRSLLAVLGPVAVAAALVVVPMRGAAQETAPHPAHIHSGTCEKLGDVAYPLADVPADVAPATPAAGGGSPIPVGVSVTTVDAKLSDLMASPHAINVHESAKEIGQYIACGDIGGTMTGNDLTIGLRTLGTYGYSGVAWLHADGDKTTVTLYLAENLSPSVMATPVAGATTVNVTLTDMKVEASQTTFKVGEPVTFVVTNNGAAEHEMVIEKRGAMDEPLMANGQEGEASEIGPGQTKSLTWTFTEPGSYQLACHVPGHFEAGMVLNIEVTG